MTEDYQGPTPPPELVEQWLAEACKQLGPYHEYVADQAARWGADQELEACCGFIGCKHSVTWSSKLRTARRPKPPSLAEEALDAMRSMQIEPCRINGITVNAELISKYDTIRRALERLQGLEARQKTGFIESHDRVGTLPAPHGQWFIGKGDLVQTEIAKQKKPNVSSTDDENLTRMGLA